MLSNSGRSNHIKCFKSRDSRELCNTREVFSLWIRQRMMWPRKITVSISKAAKPGWRGLGCLINWHQIFKTSLSYMNGDKRGFAARGCSLLIWQLHQLCEYEQLHSNIVMHKTFLLHRVCSERTTEIKLFKISNWNWGPQVNYCGFLFDCLFSYILVGELKEWKRNSFIPELNLYLRRFKSQLSSHREIRKLFLNPFICSISFVWKC